MKRNSKFNLWGWLTAAAMLLTTSCADTLDSEKPLSGEYTTVTFNIAPETLNGPVTRSGIGPEEGVNGEVTYPEEEGYFHISDGSQANMLIYAVYDETGKLLTEYAQGGNTDDVDAENRITASEGEGQTAININKFPVSITFKMRRGQTYKVAFWAQNKECKAYDTKDLKRVQVHYKEFDVNEKTEGESVTPNNDETRDAFCRVADITINTKADENQTIYLYRPLAQVNVGTTGYDYETVVQDEKSKYAYTRVQISTGCRYLNVVDDKVELGDDTGNETQWRSTLNYAYARIPAYIHYTNDDLKSFDFTKADHDKEEFLKIHLDSDDNTFMPYISYDEYKKLTAEGKEIPQTETFKYLSMCYILVPSNIEYRKENDAYEKTTLEHVQVWIATDATGKDELKIVDLTNVPVQRNYRTNIVGDIMTTDVPLTVKLDPMYSGDYNGIYSNGEAEWSGPLADGAYYDAANDEIQISNVNGLIWLQQMVNGKLLCRDSKDTPAKGKPYKYYDIDGNAHEGESDTDLLSGYITAPADEKLKARILKATHQSMIQYEDNAKKNAGTWPTNGNFHFTGWDANKNLVPAKVKLMADIDLSGIDWLPIGFDCWLYDNSIKSHYNAIENKTYSGSTGKIESRIKGTEVRAFCGIFDGNGHTISNLKNKRFGADIHATGQQMDSNVGPYDNPQWFATGLFGFVSGDATIKNLRLSNVDLYGYHTGGGIVGTVNGHKVTIDHCTVDGGQIILSPMYRGDSHNPARTFARGIYAGGIVGFFNAEGQVTDCSVRNLEMSAYRNIGGIVGTEGKLLGTSNLYPVTNAPTIANNTVGDVLIIANKFKPYDHYFSIQRDGVYKSGYGWNQSQEALSNDFVGGTATEQYSNNQAYNIIRSEFSTKATATSKQREASIEGVPLNYLPLLSSWFCDDLTLKAHFSGKPSAYKRYKKHEFSLVRLSGNTDNTKNKSDVQGTFTVFPFNLPIDLNVDFDKTSGKVGMYVESVTLKGKSTVDSYSVLTVEDVTEENDCAMFITSRDLSPSGSSFSKQSTTVSDMLVRGAPYAYTGICLSPNKYTDKVTLKNVSVYDCYQTLALDNGYTTATDVWPAKDNISGTTATLTLENSNLRGYTVPGAGWKAVNYTSVVFERGARTTADEKVEEYTCDVEAPTTFKDCTFKAPYIINIKDGGSATFNGNCMATYANSSVKVNPTAGTLKIIISVDETTGKVKVDYE